MKQLDFFILTGEPSGDIQGAKLIEALLHENPSLLIAAVSGPQMRKLPIETLFPMEELQVMGFIDVLGSLPKIIRYFFAVRKEILKRNPKAVICIDYPGLHLRLERSLRKKGYAGKLIHYICPSVWAWGKKRIPVMAKTLDLLLTTFPFEKKCFENTPLSVAYVGHPLVHAIPPNRSERKTNLFALFPGSRASEIEKNLPTQLRVAQTLLKEVPSLEIAISIAHPHLKEAIEKKVGALSVRSVDPEGAYQLMKECTMALATSGTVTLELALHETPTVVGFAISPFDVFLAQKIFQIHLPFYCIVNIILNRQIFPELFGPHFTEERLLKETKTLWFSQEKKSQMKQECQEIRHLLTHGNGARNGALSILKNVFNQTKTPI